MYCKSTPLTGKRCPQCKQRKPNDLFQNNKASRDGLQNRCTECQSAANRANQASKRKEAYCYLLEHPCIDCGEADPVVLDFDHVRGVKKLCIGTMISRNMARKEILSEMQKCEVRCANCHRRRTAVNRGWYASFNSTLIAGIPTEQKAVEIADALISEMPEWHSQLGRFMNALRTRIQTSLGLDTWQTNRENLQQHLRGRIPKV